MISVYRRHWLPEMSPVTLFIGLANLEGFRSSLMDDFALLGRAGR